MKTEYVIIAFLIGYSVTMTLLFFIRRTITPKILEEYYKNKCTMDAMSSELRRVSNKKCFPVPKHPYFNNNVKIDRVFVEWYYSMLHRFEQGEFDELNKLVK